MKRRVISALLASFMALSVFAGCGGDKGGEKFIVGFDANYPPYGYMGEDGEYTGFDLELAEAFCELEVGTGKTANRLGNQRLDFEWQ